MKSAYGMQLTSKETIAVHYVVACGYKGADMDEIKSHVSSIITPDGEQDAYYSILKKMRAEGYIKKAGKRFYGVGFTTLQDEAD